MYRMPEVSCLYRMPEVALYVVNTLTMSKLMKIRKIQTESKLQEINKKVTESYRK